MFSQSCSVLHNRWHFQPVGPESPGSPSPAAGEFHRLRAEDAVLDDCLGLRKLPWVPRGWFFWWFGVVFSMFFWRNKWKTIKKWNNMENTMNNMEKQFSNREPRILCEIDWPNPSRSVIFFRWPSSCPMGHPAKQRATGWIHMNTVNVDPILYILDQISCCIIYEIYYLWQFFYRCWFRMGQPPQLSGIVCWNALLFYIFCLPFLPWNICRKKQVALPFTLRLLQVSLWGLASAQVGLPRPFLFCL